MSGQLAFDMGTRSCCRLCGRQMPPGAWIGPTPRAWGVENIFGETHADDRHIYTCPECKAKGSQP